MLGIRSGLSDEDAIEASKLWGSAAVHPSADGYASRPNWRKSFLLTESSLTRPSLPTSPWRGPGWTSACQGSHGWRAARPPSPVPTYTHTVEADPMLGDTSPGVAAASEVAASNTSGGSGATGAQKAPGPTPSEAEESRTSNSRDIKMLVPAHTIIPNTV
jgi:hypothetical protein